MSRPLTRQFSLVVIHRLAVTLRDGDHPIDLLDAKSLRDVPELRPDGRATVENPNLVCTLELELLYAAVMADHSAIE